MNKQLLLFALFIGLLILPSFIRKAKDKTYEGNKFRFSFPYNWELTEQEGMVHVGPTGNFGGLSITCYIPFEVSDNDIPIFLTGLYHRLPEEVNMLITPKNDGTEYYFEYAGGRTILAVKAVRASDGLYVITVNCETDRWAENRPVFLKVINSFGTVKS